MPVPRPHTAEPAPPPPRSRARRKDRAARTGVGPRSEAPGGSPLPRQSARTPYPRCAGRSGEGRGANKPPADTAAEGAGAASEAEEGTRGRAFTRFDFPCVISINSLL